jgi:predicted N-acetyltransferase YhbS
LKGKKEMNMTLRNETEKDYFTVENLTREAFWNVYKPGCDEHLLVHNMRSLPCFIKELDIVAEVDGKIVGSILYSKSKLTALSGIEYESIAFGPISVHPDFQKKGIGSSLIHYTFRIAEQMGYTSVFITGNPDYYGRFGFEAASDYGIHLKGVPVEDKAEFFMVKRLSPSALSGISGVFEFDPCYDVDQTQLDEYDKQFPPKGKEKRPGQIFGS